MPFRTATLVKTVIADRTGDDLRPDLHFRIDVFSWSDSEYSCQVWRMDLYRIKPMSQDDPADEDVMVLEHGISWWDLRARTPEALLDMVFDAIERQLGTAIDRTAAGDRDP